jgi:type II secretory pathway component PulF
MLPHPKKTSFAWSHVLMTIGIALALILCGTVIWYLSAVEVPATERLQSEVLLQDTVISTIMRGASSTPSPTIRPR